MPGAPGLASETWESKEARAAEFDYTAWCVSMALYSARRPYKPKADTKEQLPACPQPPTTTKKVLAKGG